MTTQRVITLLAGVAAWACNGDTTQPRPPFDLLKSGGDAQIWDFNNPLPTPVSVTPVDGSGRPGPRGGGAWGGKARGGKPPAGTTTRDGRAAPVAFNSPAGPT